MTIGAVSTRECGGDLVVEWSIADFCTRRTDDGAFYWSPLFYFGREQWQLRIFPNGRSARDSSGHVGLDLVKCSPIPSDGQSFSLSLKIAEGKRHNEVHLTRDFDNKNWLHEIHRFMPRSELLRRKSEILPDGVLTVLCTLRSKSL